MKNLIALGILLLSLNSYAGSSISARGLLFMEGSTYQVVMNLSGNENLSQCWKETKKCYSPIGGVWKIESFPFLAGLVDLNWYQNGSYHRASSFHREGPKAYPSLLLSSTGPNGFTFYSWYGRYDAQKNSLVGEVVIDTLESYSRRLYGQMEIQMD